MDGLGIYWTGHHDRVWYSIKGHGFAFTNQGTGLAGARWLGSGKLGGRLIYHGSWGLGAGHFLGVQLFFFKLVLRKMLDQRLLSLSTYMSVSVRYGQTYLPIYLIDE